MSKYISVRPFWITTADALLFENVHFQITKRRTVLKSTISLCMLHSSRLQFTWNVTVLLQYQRSSAYVIVSIFSTSWRLREPYFVRYYLWEADVHEGERPSRRDSGKGAGGQAITTGLVLLIESTKAEPIE